MSGLIVEIDEAAEAEFYDIVEYYNQFATSLPTDFITEFEQAIHLIKEFPEAGHPYLHNTKRVILQRFP